MVQFIALPFPLCSEGKEMYKKRDARAELLFCSLNLLFFTFPLPPSSWVRKVPNQLPERHSNAMGFLLAGSSKDLFHHFQSD